MTDPFNSPASGSFKAADHNGRLLLITPTEYLPSVNTVNGATDCVDGQIVIINETDPGASDVVDNGRVFGAKLIAATKPFVGKGMVLGRLGQAPAQPGKNPAWILNDATEAEKDKARAYLATKAPQL